MTPWPRTIDPDATLGTALEQMRADGVRHLPVIDDGRAVGVLSERDVYLMHAEPPRERIVLEAMTYAPLCVPPTASVAQVARSMREVGAGSALVVENGRLVGIFTTTDALRALEREDA